MLGKFIVIEGGDGAGKTTFVNLLKQTCPQFVYSREPGGVGLSQKVRMLVLDDEFKSADSLTMFHLFWASRAENFATVILPAVLAGKIVVTDRFDVSTWGYQVGENPRLEDLFWATRDACLQGVSPIYLDFDVSLGTARARLDGRGEQNHFDKRNDEYRLKVRKHYDRFFGNRRVRSIKVDADLPKDRMLSRAMGALEVALQM
ncbi:MAG: dTMP kinase [Parcubacteria group bacterium Gr01-1014_46]|nr:MAG: dTMP kinase [Parcubacteria group bacterium Gr01-1014_46]